MPSPQRSIDRGLVRPAAARLRGTDGTPTIRCRYILEQTALELSRIRSSRASQVAVHVDPGYSGPPGNQVSRLLVQASKGTPDEIPTPRRFGPAKIHRCEMCV